MRIYSNYDKNEYQLLEVEAKKLGFSLAAFQKYCVMLAIKQDKKQHSANISSMVKDIPIRISEMKIGQSFIVSSLFPKIWPDLTRSEKMTIAKSLSLYAKKNPHMIIKDVVDNGKPTIYKKIGD